MPRAPGCRSRSCGRPTELAGNGTDDDARALAGLPVGRGRACWAPGRIRIGSDVEINGHLWFMPGAVLQTGFRSNRLRWACPALPSPPATTRSSTTAQGGAFAGDRSGRVGTVRLVPAAVGSGTSACSCDDAFRWGFLQVDVPPAPDHAIRTTVKLYHGSTVRCMWHGFPRHVVCATNDKPVFEAVGGIRHWRITGGVFDGAEREYAELLPPVRARRRDRRSMR